MHNVAFSVQTNLLVRVLHPKPLNDDLHVDPLLRPKRVQLLDGLRVERGSLGDHLSLDGLRVDDLSRASRVMVEPDQLPAKSS